METERTQPCRLSCPARLPGQQERWCAACRADYERWLDRGGELAALSLLARESQEYLPASQLEWLAHLDDVAPLVLDLAITAHDGPPEGGA